jgi:hypothetical protein
VWTEALSRLTEEQIRTGLDACLSSGQHFPPSLPEFCALAKPKRVNEAMYRAPAGPQLTKKLSSAERDHGRAQIAALKEKFK